MNLDVTPNAGVRVTDVADGTSNTVAFSESLLGAGGPNQTGATGDVRLLYKQVTRPVARRTATPARRW